MKPFWPFTYLLLLWQVTQLRRNMMTALLQAAPLCPVLLWDKSSTHIYNKRPTMAPAEVAPVVSCQTLSQPVLPPASPLTTPLDHGARPAVGDS